MAQIGDQQVASRLSQQRGLLTQLIGCCTQRFTDQRVDVQDVQVVRVVVWKANVREVVRGCVHDRDHPSASHWNVKVWNVQLSVRREISTENLAFRGRALDSDSSLAG